MLDGFDEISFDYQLIVIKFMKIFKNCVYVGYLSLYIFET